MAFSNIRRVDLGGGLALLVGDYTHTVGASDQTLGLGHAQLIGGSIRPNVTAEPIDFRGDLFDTSLSGGITTVTLRSEAGIAGGKFWMLIDSGG